MDSIEGLKLIKHNRQRIDRPDDPSYPFKIEVILWLEPGINDEQAAKMGGREEVVVRALTVGAVEELVRGNGYLTHPRLVSLTLTGPKGVFKLS